MLSTDGPGLNGFTEIEPRFVGFCELIPSRPAAIRGAKVVLQASSRTQMQNETCGARLCSSSHQRGSADSTRAEIAGQRVQ